MGKRSNYPRIIHQGNTVYILIAAIGNKSLDIRAQQLSNFKFSHLQKKLYNGINVL